MVLFYSLHDNDLKKKIKTFQIIQITCAYRFWIIFWFQTLSPDVSLEVFRCYNICRWFTCYVFMFSVVLIFFSQLLCTISRCWYMYMLSDANLRLMNPQREIVLWRSKTMLRLKAGNISFKTKQSITLYEIKWNIFQS